MSTEVERLHAACERDLGDPLAGWPGSTAYPNALALCIIDAIYVTGARHLTVERIVERYRGHRAGQGATPTPTAPGSCWRASTASADPRQWASQIGNRRPTSTAKGAPLRSAALLAAAHALVELGIRTAEDLRTAAQ